MRLLVALLAVGCVACQSAPDVARDPVKPRTTQSIARTGAPSTAASRTAAPSTALAQPKPTVPPNPGGLTDAELVGQLFVGYAYGSGPDGATPEQRAANLALYEAETPAEVVRRWHLGGVILIGANTIDPARPDLWSDNVDNGPQIAALTAGLQAAAKKDSGVTLLIATDQEGGGVQRITNGVDQRPSEADLAYLGGPRLRCSYYMLGEQLRALGVNQDYAPVADVLRVGSTVIGNRSFGADPALVAMDVQAATDGLRAASVLPTLKHWPGHGGVSADSHYALPKLEQSISDWERLDRPPFRAATSGLSSVMVGHLAFPAADPTGTPATLSSALVDGQLRTRLGFHGLVVTDSLWMQPMLDAGTPAQVARRAISAGVDMLLMSPDVPHSSAELLKAVRTDEVFRARVQAAVGRILATKAALSRPATPPVGC